MKKSKRDYKHTDKINDEKSGETRAERMKKRKIRQNSKKRSNNLIRKCGCADKFNQKMARIVVSKQKSLLATIKQMYKSCNNVCRIHRKQRDRKECAHSHHICQTKHNLPFVLYYIRKMFGFGRESILRTAVLFHLRLCRFYYIYGLRRQFNNSTNYVQNG